MSVYRMRGLETLSSTLFEAEPNTGFLVTLSAVVVRVWLAPLVKPKAEILQATPLATADSGFDVTASSGIGDSFKDGAAETIFARPFPGVATIPVGAPSAARFRGIKLTRASGAKLGRAKAIATKRNCLKLWMNGVFTVSGPKVCEERKARGWKYAVYGTCIRPARAKHKTLKADAFEWLAANLHHAGSSRLQRHYANVVSGAPQSACYSSVPLLNPAGEVGKKQFNPSISTSVSSRESWTPQDISPVAPGQALARQRQSSILSPCFQCART